MMKVQSTIFKRCSGCYFAFKKGILHMRCVNVAKHKRRQGTNN